MISNSVTLTEKIEDLFTQVKKCPNDQISHYFETILETYPLLPKKEKKEIAESFYKWVSEHASSNQLKLAYANYMLAFNEFFDEKYDATLLICNESQKLFTEQNEANGVAICSSLQGATYRTLGNVDMALNALWEAHDQLNRSKIFSHNLMACSYQIASIYVENKNFEEAFPLFKTTLEKAEKLQNQIWIVNALHGLGKVFLKQKKYLEAKEYLEKAVNIAEKVNNPLFISTSLTDLANYYYESDNYDLAEQKHLQALAIREQCGYIGGAITSIICLSEIYLKQNKPDEAIQILEKGIKFATELKVKPKTFQIHLLFSKAYEQKHDLSKSLYHYRLYHQIQEEVEKEDAAKKVKNIQLIFEAEQTKKENIIIKKQKKEIEEKNIELQETIDELTITKVSKKAKIITMVIAIVLFIAEEIIHHSVLHLMHDDDFVMSLVVKGIIVISLKPIDSAVEHFLLKNIIKKKIKTV